MKILDKLLKLGPLVVADKDNVPPGTLGRDLSNLAVDAITDGLGSPAWVKYMSLFADNKAQLERLTVQKPGEPGYLKRHRAYIVSNAVCDINTTTNTAAKVGEDIDLQLDAAVDGQVVRPFVIPGLDA